MCPHEPYNEQYHTFHPHQCKTKSRGAAELQESEPNVGRAIGVAWSAKAARRTAKRARRASQLHLQAMISSLGPVVKQVLHAERHVSIGRQGHQPHQMPGRG